MSFQAPLRRSFTATLGRRMRISQIASGSRNHLLHTSSRLNAAASSSTEEAVNATTGTSYPFSSSVITRSHAVATDSSTVTQTKSGKDRKNRGIMAALHAQLRDQYDPTGSFTSLFSRNSIDRVPSGSIIIVETWNDAKKVTFSSFAGALIAIRRRHTSSSFVLRNLVNKTGVEQRFNLYSPLIKDIKIVQRAIGSKRDSRLRRTRRAKLYYLRKYESRLPNITRAIQTMRLRENDQKAR